MFIFVVLVEFGAHMQTLNLSTQETAYQRITDAVQLASQDAVEQLEPDSIAMGQPIFNTTQADLVFRTDLANNLQLNPTTLAPLPNTLLQTPPVIKEEEFYDWSNATFPDSISDTASGIEETITEPSILYLLQFTIPSVGDSSQPFVINVPVLQSYNGS